MTRTVLAEHNINRVGRADDHTTKENHKKKDASISCER